MSLGPTVRLAEHEEAGASAPAVDAVTLDSVRILEALLACVRAAREAAATGRDPVGAVAWTLDAMAGHLSADEAAAVAALLDGATAGPIRGSTSSRRDAQIRRLLWIHPAPDDLRRSGRQGEPLDRGGLTDDEILATVAALHEHGVLLRLPSLAPSFTRAALGPR